MTDTVKEHVINKLNAGIRHFQPIEMGQLQTIARDEQEKENVRAAACKVLWELAETKMYECEKQIKIYKNIYLQLQHELAIKADQDKMHGLLASVLKNVDGERLREITSQLKIKAERKL